jgi:hypothetical protein
LQEWLHSLLLAPCQLLCLLLALVLLLVPLELLGSLRRRVQ